MELKLVEEQSNQEIARRLGLNESTVATRIQRGKAMPGPRGTAMSNMDELLRVTLEANTLDAEEGASRRQAKPLETETLVIASFFKSLQRRLFGTAAGPKFAAVWFMNIVRQGEPMAGSYFFLPAIFCIHGRRADAKSLRSSTLPEGCIEESRKAGQF